MTTRSAEVSNEVQLIERFDRAAKTTPGLSVNPTHDGLAFLIGAQAIAESIDRLMVMLDKRLEALAVDTEIEEDHVVAGFCGPH